MSKKVLIRKEAGGGIMYTRDIGRGQGGGFRQDLAALRGGAMGLNPQGGQSFIPGAQLPGTAPTRMQRLGAGANLAGRGLAAALTGLQTAYGLQGGNVGALGSVADTYAQNVPGLTRNNPTEAQQGQNMATEAYNQNQQTMAQNAVQQSAQQIMNPNQSGPTGTPLPGQPPSTPLGQLPPAGLPPQPPVPAQPAAPVPAPPVPAATTPAATTPAVTQIAGPLSQFGVEQQQQPTETQQPPMQSLTPTGEGSVQATLTQGHDPTFGGRVNEADMTIDNIRFGSQTAFDLALKNRGLAKSFVQAIYDEMGDALYKADPHIAGLIISRIYMDKFVR